MNPIRLPMFAVLAVAMLVLGACQQPAVPTASTSSPSAASGAVAAASAAAASGPARQCMPQEAARPSSADAPKAVDKPRPTLKVTTFDCKPYDLASQRGHWVVVNFWATWCGPCLQEIPDLTNFVKSRKDVAVIGLDFEDGVDARTMAAFLQQHAPGYPIAVVDPYDPPADFDPPRALPTSYLIGPDGAVVHKFLGPIKINELEQRIERR